MIAHNTLAKILAEIPVSPVNTISQYIDDILIEGKSVRDMMESIQRTLLDLGLEIPDSKCRGPAQKVKFLGVSWFNRAASVPQDTLEKENMDLLAKRNYKFWEP